MGLRNDYQNNNTYNLNNSKYVSNPIIENFDAKGYFLEEPINKKSLIEFSSKQSGCDSYKFKKAVIPLSTKSSNKKSIFFKNEEENNEKNDSFEDFVKGLSCKTIVNTKINQESKRLNLCLKTKK